MTFQRVPDVAQVKLVAHSDPYGDEIVNDLYMLNILTPWDATTLAQICSDVVDWWTGVLKPIQHSGYVLDKVTALSLDVEFGAYAEQAVGVAGTSGGSAVPYSVAAVVKMKGNPGDPPRHGFNFVSGLSEAQVDANSLTSGYKASLTTAYTNLSTYFSDGDVLHCVVSRFSGMHNEPGPHNTVVRRPTKRATAVRSVVTGYTVRTIVGSQKDRRS